MALPSEAVIDIFASTDSKYISGEHFFQWNGRLDIHMFVWIVLEWNFRAYLQLT